MNASRLRHRSRLRLRQTQTPARRANVAELSGELHRGNFFVDASGQAGVAQLSTSTRWGWDGACLESVSAFSHDPIGYVGGDMNLYEYCGDWPIGGTDPSGESVMFLCWKCLCDDPERIAQIENKSIIDPRAGTCRVKINCTPNTSWSGGETHPAVRPVAGHNTWEITIDINSAMSCGSQEAMLIHELTHARQMCARHGRGCDNMGTCKKMESEAYAKSCQYAFPNNPAKQGRCRACGLWFGCSRFNRPKPHNGNNVHDPGGCTDADVGIRPDEVSV
jgi:hypothetical protein